MLDNVKVVAEILRDGLLKLVLMGLMEVLRRVATTAVQIALLSTEKYKMANGTCGSRQTVRMIYDLSHGP